MNSFIIAKLLGMPLKKKPHHEQQGYSFGRLLFLQKSWLCTQYIY